MENLAVATPVESGVEQTQNVAEVEKSLPEVRELPEKKRGKQRWFALVKYKEATEPQVIEGTSRAELRKMLNNEAEKLKTVYFACRGHEVKIREKRSLFL